MTSVVHPLDPRTIDFSCTWRLYGGPLADVEALVDEEDYVFFGQWLWVPKASLGGKKLYLRRAVGVSNRGRIYTYTCYLHVEILTRAEGLPPDDSRVIADHINGDSLDCRRRNLRWITKAQNNRNRFGKDAVQGSML
jgi:hypothetical protein